jgi:hypothetical protein
MRWLQALAGCLVALATSACAPVSEQYFREGVGVTLNSGQLAQATQLQDDYVYYICRQAGGFNVETAVGPSCDPSSNWTAFTVAGMNDIDQRCDAYLDWLDAQRRDRTPVLAQIAAMGAATSGIMGVAGAGTQAIAIVATAFGLAGQSYANWNSRLLLDVDHSTVQAVVYGNQVQYRKDNASLISTVPDRPSAIYLLRNYLRLCMPISIETNINNTVTLVQKGVSPSNLPPLVQSVAVSNVVTKVGTPLPTPHPFVNPHTPATAGHGLETGLTGFKIKQIQRAVCVSSPSDDWGNAEAQSNLSEFFKAAGLGTPKTIGANEMDALQVAIFSVTKRHTCQEAGFNGPEAVGQAVKAMHK